MEQGNVFRLNYGVTLRDDLVSIPLEQGNVFRHSEETIKNEERSSQSLWNRAMSFDPAILFILRLALCLNPFGTGQCLSTYRLGQVVKLSEVSIPLEQGNVFRQEYCDLYDPKAVVSIPLEQGNVFRLDEHS